jgi:cyclopropane-fatty-acyl-phospholipid synthase
MNWLLHKLCRKVFRTGVLIVTDATGKEHAFGSGKGKRVHIALRSKATERAVALNPTLAVPEAYMDGDLDLIEGSVLDLLELTYANTSDISANLPIPWLLEIGRFAMRRLHQLNTAGRARRNVHHHYDLSRDFYRLFLDADMQYSCAYFEPGQGDLDEAQRAKKRHIAAKLKLRPGLDVLDIGSGWGGLGLFLAAQGANVEGVTLSTEQLMLARERAQRAGLADRARFDLMDYRAIDRTFDRIVSVGMFEHVGVNHYRAYFDKCAAMLRRDGVMVLHTIGRSGPPAATNAFIRKHIFPGGYIPSLSEMMPAIERAGLIVTDIEILRLHYAETLKAWRERFLANRYKAVALYDERFARMWEFYLAGSEAAFRWQDMVVFQIQMARRNDVLPITRDYIGADRDAMVQPRASRRSGGYRHAAE